MHSGLSLPIQQNRQTVQCFLSDKKLQELKNKYDKTHCFLIDEASPTYANSFHL